MIYLQHRNRKLTNYEKKGIVAIVLLSICSCVFWLLYFQQDLAMIIYMDKYVNTQIGPVVLAPHHLTVTWNSLLCIILNLLAARLWEHLSKRPQGDISIFKKVVGAFALLGGAYFLLAMMELNRGLQSGPNVKANAIWIVGFEVLLTMAEICFSPLGVSFVNKVAPRKYISLLMGVWSMSTFIATFINGFVERYIEKWGILTILIFFAILSFIIAICIAFFNNSLNSLVEDNK